MELLGGDEEISFTEDEKIAYILKPKSMKVLYKMMDAKALSSKGQTKDSGIRLDPEFWAFFEEKNTCKNSNAVSNRENPALVILKAMPSVIKSGKKEESKAPGVLKVNYYSQSRGQNITLETFKVNKGSSHKEQLSGALKTGLALQNCEGGYMQSSFLELKELIMKIAEA